MPAPIWLAMAMVSVSALTFLAGHVNRDANRVRNYRYDDDFRGETHRTWNVNDRVNRKKNSG